MLPISMDSRVERLETTLRFKGNIGGATLLHNMVIKAENNAEYGKQLVKYLGNKSTLLLRDLASEFGDYWGSIKFANIVDEIDSATTNV